MINKNFVLSAASAIALIFAASAASAQEAVTTDIDWSKGSPRFTSSDGQFQFRIRARYLMDAYAVQDSYTTAAGVKSTDQSNSGFGTRDARLGLEGKLNGVWGFKTEVSFSNGSLAYRDMYLSYDNNGYEVILGNSNAANPLEEISSSTVNLLNERTFVDQAFGTEGYTTGIIVRKYSDNWMILGALQSDKGENSETALSKSGGLGVASVSQNFATIRGDWAINNTKGSYLVVGGFARYRDNNGTPGTNGLGYSFRPAQTAYGPNNMISAATAVKDTTYGVEGIFQRGSFFMYGEYSVINAENSAGVSYDFSGGALEASYFLTGEVRAYDSKTGEIKSLKPNSPFQEGGYGAWALVGRVDAIDLKDRHFAGGGTATGYSAGLFWQPTDLVSFRATYGRTDYKMSTDGVSNNGGKGSVDAFNIRTQFNF